MLLEHTPRVVVPLERDFCMESREYYRRDNYRLLERIEKEELRKRGLLVHHLPISLQEDNEMVQSDQPRA